MNEKKLVNFIFELNHLKRQKHVGLFRAGLKDIDSVAEHVFRATQIAYLLATLEECNPEKSALITLIHDNAETRTGDHDKVQSAYINTEEIEKKAFNDQLLLLPKKISNKWKEYINEYNQTSTPEGIVARDADLLELAFEAKEKLDTGYKGAKIWLNNIEKRLQTKSAKKIFLNMKKSDFNNWYKNI